MLTLTCDTKRYDSPEHAARRMSWALPKLIADMRRWAGDAPVEYLAVWERTRAGWPHLHVLLLAPYIPQRLVSQWWQRLTLSPVVFFTALGGSRSGARYVTKYLTKDPDPYGQGRALRASRGFLVEPMRPQGRRFCTLGKLRVYEGDVWTWIAEELGRLHIVELDDTGQALSAAWSASLLDDSSAWLLWGRQREAVARRLRPPLPPVPLLPSPVWGERQPDPTAHGGTGAAACAATPVAPAPLKR